MTKPFRVRRALAGPLLMAVALLAPLALGGAAHADEPLDEGPGASSVHGAALQHERTGPPAREVLTVDETDCFEVVVTRAADYDRLRERVPERYGVLRSATGLGRISVVDVRCEVSIEGHPPRTTTSSYVVAALSSRDGVSSTSSYLLAHGVDNPELAARYRATGLPTHWQPETTASETVADDGSDVALSWKVVGDGMDHVLTGVAAHPLTRPVETSETSYFHDGPRGDLVLVFRNTVRIGPVLTSAGAAVTADFTAASEIASLVAAPSLLQLRGATRFTYVRGDWTTTLARLP